MDLFKNPRGNRRNPLLWIVIIGALVLYTQYEGSLFGDPDDPRVSQAMLTGGDIGGPFALIDHTGQAVTDADYLGKHMLVYFGYSWCPDVCPIDLLVVGEVMSRIENAEAKLQPLFITLDPARDTVEKLAGYVPNFHDSLIGLTGPPAATEDAAKRYRVYHRSAKKDEADTEYLVDHSSILYLMGPDGKFLTHFMPKLGPDKIVRDIERYL